MEEIPEWTDRSKQPGFMTSLLVQFIFLLMFISTFSRGDVKPQVKELHTSLAH